MTQAEFQQEQPHPVSYLRVGGNSRSVSTDYQLIKGAIINKQHVIAIYKGKYREMCPHVIGSKRGKLKALFWQFAGESNSEPYMQGGWRDTFVVDVQVLEIREGVWQTGPRHSRMQHSVDVVDVEVDY